MFVSITKSTFPSRSIPSGREMSAKMLSNRVRSAVETCSDVLALWINVSVHLKLVGYPW